MNVPNENKVPFREMTKEERSAIVDAWVSEIGCEVLRDGDWRNSNSMDFMLDANNAYRTRQRQLVIPWGVIRDDIAWFFMSSKGRKWGVTQSCYDTKPEINGEDWICDGGSKWFSLDAINIDTTGIDWRESLVQRPESA